MKKKSFIFYILIFLNFFILPVFMRNTGSAMVFLLIVMPLFCFFISLFHGVKIGFYPGYPIFVSLIFIPTIFIYYSASAWIYAILFGIIALIGDAVGNIFRRKR